MTVQDISTLVNTVGFPIVAYGALFWMLNTTMKELTAAINKLSDKIGDAPNVAS